MVTDIRFISNFWKNKLFIIFFRTTPLYLGLESSSARREFCALNFIFTKSLQLAVPMGRREETERETWTSKEEIFVFAQVNQVQERGEQIMFQRFRIRHCWGRLVNLARNQYQGWQVGFLFLARLALQPSAVLAQPRASSPLRIHFKTDKWREMWSHGRSIGILICAIQWTKMFWLSCNNADIIESSFFCWANNRKQNICLSITVNLSGINQNHLSLHCEIKNNQDAC